MRMKITKRLHKYAPCADIQGKMSVTAALEALQTNEIDGRSLPKTCLSYRSCGMTIVGGSKDSKATYSSSSNFF